MKNFESSRRSGVRLIGASVLIAGTFLSASAAQATPLDRGDQAKARAAATSLEATGLVQQAVKAQAGQQATGTARQAVAAAVDALSKGPSALRVDPDAIPVYALNPAFVHGTSKEPGTLFYVAFGATQGTSKQTLFTAPGPSGEWKAVNVASGDVEQRMSRLARGGELLLEPQIGAWYSVSGKQVSPLNASAVSSIGKAPVSLSSYQRKVASAYGDKLPGSEYGSSGMAGGFDAKGRVDPQRSIIHDAQPVAPSEESAASLMIQRVTAFVGAAVVLAAVALGWVLFRRRAVRS
ncbi:hypothetical protein [Arthrobacter sp.]|uniref:hypothetical protein n=1 Tax=Arthrobacter sp. TaxID=1667 RepID=UPI0025842C2F|nr:hypothetical protein [Arthrobacter sp.]